MLSKDEIVARSLRLSGRAPNRYTGTLNDPFQDAQSNYAGPGWGQFFGGLQKTEEDAQLAGKNYRMDWSGFGNATSDGGGSMPRRRRTSLAQMGNEEETSPAGLSEDGARSWAINTALSDMQDQRRAREQEQRILTAQADIAEAEAAQARIPMKNLDAINRAYGAAQIPAGVNPGEIRQTGQGSYQSRGAGPLADPREVMARNLPGHLQPTSEKVTFGAPVKATVTVDGTPKQVFVRTGSDGLTYDMGRQVVPAEAIAPEAEKEKMLSGMDALYKGTDPKAITAAIRRGDHPPDISQYGRPVQGAIASELAKLGPDGEPPYKLADAQQIWSSQKRLNQTMNGNQQVRLDTSIRSGLRMYDVVDELSAKWEGMGLGPLSRANLKLAMEGAKGPEAASIANQLNGQIGQLTSDIATIEQGGLTPTNESRAVAEKSMQSWWGDKTIKAMTAQGRLNMRIREQARQETQPLTIGNSGPVAGGGTVEMLDPNGAILDVPIADVEKALAAGAKRKGGG